MEQVLIAATLYMKLYARRSYCTLDMQSREKYQAQAHACERLVSILKNGMNEKPKVRGSLSAMNGCQYVNYKISCLEKEIKVNSLPYLEDKE